MNGDLDGSGNGCVAVVEDSNIDEVAANEFNTQFGLPALTGSNFSTVLVDGTTRARTATNSRRWSM